MPYIKQKDQKRLLPLLQQIQIGSKGELTYCINILQMLYCEQRFKHMDGSNQKVNYDMVSDARASAIDASFEWQERVMKKYEQHKIQENGDVFQDFIRRANI